ncbi:hypothetical protein [Burkholderia sp. BCC1998]|uniref:hypothetical protein n=1 Tax=Burkholderia sp. BCC1998 TaxID=2817447 RepID=UPI002AB7CF75|nr:hypothetical protein [Burkholderia sp. BCC1998]
MFADDDRASPSKIDQWIERAGASTFIHSSRLRRIFIHRPTLTFCQKRPRHFSRHDRPASCTAGHESNDIDDLAALLAPFW